MQYFRYEHSKIEIHMVLYSFHPSPGNPAVQKHQVWCGDHLHCEEDHAVQKVTTSQAVYRLCDGNDKEIRDNFQSVIAKPPI